MGLLKWLVVIRTLENGASVQAGPELSFVEELILVFVLFTSTIAGLVWAWWKTKRENAN